MAPNSFRTPLLSTQAVVKAYAGRTVLKNLGLEIFLVKRPRPSLLDEPLSALDAKLRHQMQLELKPLQREVASFSRQSPTIGSHPRSGGSVAMSGRAAVLQDGGLQPLGTSLRSEIAALISTEIGYATPNRAALTHPDPRVMADRTIHPRTKGLRNTEFQQAVGDAALQI